MMAFGVSREHCPGAMGGVYEAACAGASGGGAQAIDVFVFSDWTPGGAGGKILSIPSATRVMASMKSGHSDEHHDLDRSARFVRERCLGSPHHVFAR